MAAVYKRASAKRDVVEHYMYLAENAGIETAERFLSSADESFRDLSMHPRNREQPCPCAIRAGRVAQVANQRI